MEKLEIEKVVVKEELKKDDNVLLTITIEYPQISGPLTPPQKHINQYYENVSKKLMKYGKEVLLPMQMEAFEYAKIGNVPFREGELFLTYDLTFQNECLLSFVFDQYEFLGGAHGSTDRFSQTWDTTTGEFIKLENCFASPKYYKEESIEMIRSQITKEIEHGESKYYKECFIDVEHMFKDSNFYISDKGVVIYFQQYEIAPYASGIPEFVLPFGAAIKLAECNE